MTSPKVITVLTYSLLTIAAAASFSLPNSLPTTKATPPPSPAEIQLTGIIRDFRTYHPDFSGSVSSGQGHTAMNVNMLLPGDGLPTFSPNTGFKVTTEWKDSAARNIAPSNFQRRGGLLSGTPLGFRLASVIELKNESMIDAFNSNFGPYGVAGNYGARAMVTTNSTSNKAIKTESKSVMRANVYVGPGGSPTTVIDNKGLITGSIGILAEAYSMPNLGAPDDLTGFTAVKNITTNTTWTGDTNFDDDNDVDALYFGTLNITSNAKVTVVGDVRVYCTTDFIMDNASIELADEDAQLTVFVGNNLTFKNQSLVNTSSGDSSSVVFNILGNKNVKFEKTSFVYATIVAPDSELHLKDDSHLAGGCVAKSMKLEDRAQAHADNGNAMMGRINYAVTVRDKFILDDTVVVDSFDSNLGPYGGANQGSKAIISSNATKKDKVNIKKNSIVNGDVLVGPNASPNTVIKLETGGSITGFKGNVTEAMAIPSVTPAAIGASIGNVTYKNVTQTISANTRFNDLKLENAIINISGDVTLRVDKLMEMKVQSEIRLLPNSTLTLYLGKNLKMEIQSAINLNGDPKRVSIRKVAGKKTKIDLQKKSSITAWAQGPKMELRMDDSKFYGSFIGQMVQAKNKSELHVDVADLNLCADANDVQGVAGALSNGDIASANSFAEWFSDVLGVNLSYAHVITLTKNGSGVYEYLTNAFYPIDGMLLGDEGAHNSQFTYSIHADFTYEQCAGQFIEFQGGDGTWMFVNNQLVMDLGGMGSGVSQYVDLDRLGLAGGQTYSVEFFYSQRQATSSTFRLRTNINLSTQAFLPTVSAAYD